MSEALSPEMAQPHIAQSRLGTLETPCLIIDAERMDRNIARLQDRLAPMGVPLRPHLKTAKSIEVAVRAMPSPQGPATVSTLKEAEFFAAAGVRDIIYAVGITPCKLTKVIELRRSGVDLAVILDTVEQAEAVALASRTSGNAIPALIEMDCDGQPSHLSWRCDYRRGRKYRRGHDHLQL
jgi:D-serine deaminase-like pyridoxal phosphate-dependent protein